MRKHVPHPIIRHLLFPLLLFALVLCSFPSVGAIGYDAAAARSDVASGDPVVNIMTYDYEHGAEVIGSIWYGIYDAEGLRRFSFLVNNESRFRSASVHVCLCSSIDMSGEPSLEPIGNGIATFNAAFPTVSFGGTFDGRGYVIDNLTAGTAHHSTKKTIAYTALFGAVREGAIIRNLVIGRGCSFVGDADYSISCTASLAARVAEGARITDVLNLAPVSAGVYCGGLVARVDSIYDRSDSPVAIMENCTNGGDVSGGTAVGGLVGNVQGNLTLTNCVCRAKVTAEGTAGGAIGTADKIPSNNLNGDVSPKTVSARLSKIQAEGALTGTAVGGIIGKSGSASVSQTDCEHFDSEQDIPEETARDVLGVRFHGVQLAENPKDQTVSLRFIASVDAKTVYTSAGFRISANGSDTKAFPCSVLFRSLLGMADDTKLVYTAEQLRGGEGYLFAATFAGGSLSDGDAVGFSVSAYASDAAPTATYSMTLTKTNGGYTVTWNR